MNSNRNPAYNEEKELTTPDASIGDKDRWSTSRYPMFSSQEEKPSIPNVSIGDNDRYSEFSSLKASKDEVSIPENSIGDNDRYSNRR